MKENESSFGLHFKPSVEWLQSCDCQVRAVRTERCSSGMSSRRDSALAAHFLIGKPPARQIRSSCSLKDKASATDEAPVKMSSTYTWPRSTAAPSGNRCSSSSANCLNVRIARNGADASPYVTVFSRCLTVFLHLSLFAPYNSLQIAVQENLPVHFLHVGRVHESVLMPSEQYVREPW